MCVCVHACVCIVCVCVCERVRVCVCHYYDIIATTASRGQAQGKDLEA